MIRCLKEGARKRACFIPIYRPGNNSWFLDAHQYPLHRPGYGTIV